MLRIDTMQQTVLYIAFELANSNWRLVFSNGIKKLHVTILARDLDRLSKEIDKAKQLLKLNDDVQIVSCYKAGRDFFWLHRCLLSWGIENIIVDSSSIEVNRRLEGE